MHLWLIKNAHAISDGNSPRTRSMVSRMFAPGWRRTMTSTERPWMSRLDASTMQAPAADV